MTRAPRRRPQQVDDPAKRDEARCIEHRDRPEHGGPDHEVARELLGPGQRRIERVAAEHLQHEHTCHRVHAARDGRLEEPDQAIPRHPGVLCRACGPGMGPHRSITARPPSASRRPPCRRGSRGPARGRPARLRPLRDGGEAGALRARVRGLPNVRFFLISCTAFAHRSDTSRREPGATARRDGVSLRPLTGDGVLSTDRLPAVKTRAPARWRPRYALRPAPAGRPEERVQPECSAGPSIAGGGGRLRDPASVQGAPGRRTEEVSGRAGSGVGKPCGHECPAPVTSTPNRHGHVFALASRPRSPLKRRGRRDAYARPLYPTQTPPARSPSGFAAIWNPQVPVHSGQEPSPASGARRHGSRADVRPGPRTPEKHGGMGHLRLQEITVFPQLQRVSPAPTSGHRVPVSRHSARACARV